MNATVIRAGFLTTVQDLGRFGFRESGVSAGGALDQHALRVANLLVGNDEADAGLEITLGGFCVRFDDERLVSWCGGDFDIYIGSTALPPGHFALVCADEEVIVDKPRIGCRAWFAISGGIDVPIVLGSRSTDLRARFGGLDGRALQDRDTVPLGENSARAKDWIDNLRSEKIAPISASHDWVSTAKVDPILRVVRGSDWNRFDAATHRVLTSELFTISSDSDRMGARLEGPELNRIEKSDLVSEAVVPGTIQVPPSGQPIVLLGDCQTIGGYPKIAHVITVDLPIAAQLRPGDQVRFLEIHLGEAYRRLAERNHDLEQFRVGLQLHTP
jgi:antagonist of KipI